MGAVRGIIFIVVIYTVALGLMTAAWASPRRRLLWALVGALGLAGIWVIVYAMHYALGGK